MLSHMCSRLRVGPGRTGVLLLGPTAAAVRLTPTRWSQEPPGRPRPARRPPPPTWLFSPALPLPARPLRLLRRRPAALRGLMTWESSGIIRPSHRHPGPPWSSFSRGGRRLPSVGALPCRGRGRWRSRQYMPGTRAPRLPLPVRVEQTGAARASAPAYGRAVSAVSTTTIPCGVTLLLFCYI